MGPPSAIAIVVPFAAGRPAPPEAWPLGRAALELGSQGHGVVFCQPDTPVTQRDGQLRVAGQRAAAGRWEALGDQVITGAYLRVSALAELRRLRPLATTLQQAGVPLCNPLALVALCRDKWCWAQAARRAALPCPASVSEPEDMAASLRAWGGGFLKPRLGACGRDVVRLRLSGDRVQLEAAGPVRELPAAELGTWLQARQEREPQLLQREVVVAGGPWRALSIRSLVQRLPSGAWRSCTPVVRLTTDAVAGNFSQGAAVTPLSRFAHAIGGRPGAELGQQVARLDQAVTAAVDAELGDAAPLALEVGIDYVPDDAGQLHCIEVNDTPQGRLAVVAGGQDDELTAAHAAAMRRPLTYLLTAPPALARAARRLRTQATPTLP